jgi:tetratricopeptide (TPR) repeat protein
LKLNQQKKALDAFQKAFQKDNKDYQICLKIEELYLFLNEPVKAGKFLYLYNSMRDTSMWEYNFLMGKMFMQNKKYMMAFYQFQKAYDENINHEASQYYRAVSADNFMKDKSKALDYYTNYIETYEDEKDAKFIEIALRRETEIRRELFMKK